MEVRLYLSFKVRPYLILSLLQIAYYRKDIAEVFTHINNYNNLLLQM